MGCLSKRFFTGLLLVCAGCGPTVEGALERAHETRQAPENFTVEYDDRTDQWGGDRIVLTGAGRLSVWHYGPRVNPSENTQDPTTRQVGRDEVLRAVELLLSLDAWDQAEADNEDRADDSRARLSISTDDARSQVWEWKNDLEANRRLLRIKQHLLELALIGAPESEPQLHPEPEVD